MRTLLLLVALCQTAFAGLPFSVGDSAHLAANDPRRFSGLVGYYRGSYLGGYADQAIIPTWPDCSGNGFDLTQPTDTAKPRKSTDYMGYSVASFLSKSNQLFAIHTNLTIHTRSNSIYMKIRGMGYVSSATPVSDSGTTAYADFGSGSKELMYMGGSPWTQIVYDGGGHSIITRLLSSTTQQSVSWRLGVSNIKMWDGVTNITVASPLATNTLTGGRIGGAASFTFPFNGDIEELAIYNRTLSDSEDAAVLKSMAPAPFTRNVIFDGDSLTAGYNSAQSGILFITNYPYQTCRLTPQIHGNNMGKTSATFTNLPVVALSPFIDTTNFKRNIVVIWCGTNDIFTDGINDTTCIARYKYYVNARQTEGWKVIILSMIVRGQFNSTMEGYRVAFNAYLRTNNAWADGFADVANDSRLQDTNNATYFQSDKIHLTQAGYGVVAEVVSPVINSL